MGKQKKIRGTKPTLVQRRILDRNQMDPNLFMFVKEIIRHEDDSSSKSLSRNSSKTRYLQFVNRESGELIELEGL